jgi:hypothetical protein
LEKPAQPNNKTMCGRRKESLVFLLEMIFMQHYFNAFDIKKTPIISKTAMPEITNTIT